MNYSLHNISVACFFIDLTIAIFVVAWLIFLNNQDRWLAMAAREAAFWHRIRFPAVLVNFSRRFAESRVFVYCLWCVLVICLVGLVVNGIHITLH